MYKCMRSITLYIKYIRKDLFNIVEINTIIYVNLHHLKKDIYTDLS